MERQTYTVPEAAEILGIGRTAAYQAVRTGDIPTVRIGRRLSVPVKALERPLNAVETTKGTFENCVGATKDSSETQ